MVELCAEAQHSGSGSSQVPAPHPQPPTARFWAAGGPKNIRSHKERRAILLALLETVILCWIFLRQQYSGVGDILEHPGGSISAGGDDVRSGEPNAGQAGATSSQEKDEEEENQN